MVMQLRAAKFNHTKPRKAGVRVPRNPVGLRSNFGLFHGKNWLAFLRCPSLLCLQTVIFQFLGIIFYFPAHLLQNAVLFLLDLSCLVNTQELCFNY